MQFLYYALFAAGIVAVDQLSKYFTCLLYTSGIAANAAEV